MSLIYKSRVAYELAMLTLYRRYYFARYEALAKLIPPGADVLELCCGPGILYDRYLRRKHVRYLGLDVSRHFVTDLTRRGIPAEQWNLQGGRPLPRAEYVVMQASLYQFLPDAAPILNRMLEAAENAVILAEPIRNLASSRMPIISSLARRLTDPGIGSSANRFVEATLDELVAQHQDLLRQVFLAPGGREKIYLFDKALCHV